jgi:hypothetical protein
LLGEKWNRKIEILLKRKMRHLKKAQLTLIQSEKMGCSTGSRLWMSKSPWGVPEAFFKIVGIRGPEGCTALLPKQVQ